ncbi:MULTISPECIES: type II toxin-antitoxin system RelE/ParE family toxin [Halieaceae]|jgi:putative addiction module killer protein|uniref:Addiction module antitoxin RelB n=2 Tax=Halieaceae TaxID=1706372 RepID=A0A2N5XYV8_9GAMM|nr:MULTISPECIES: type II toxin-antitoxin system RelE/ParE family toxin [Halieaceae]HAN26353.1 type II toxin-antitoxin system RelE/ParE family toxin [Haliea salexigens]MAA86143.1 addiction module antitoxin RelB [Haliea sp.]MAD65027.1 addiction module antitoxin RelB [Haliea sp.]MAY94521.1 addiction module antitoxin RelB [Haliea sp.]MBP71526.1 addiction module antitoxin RelB [Haliea sp.]|tara:strand:- start:10555 stop:10851 length:297 start_codon:yes stop_codon:yes gene_type:complete
MYEVYKTDEFARWFKKLRDRQAKSRILARIDRLEQGHFGDVESVGDGVSELRVFYGPGYRIYFTRRSSVVVILLSGGDKSSQSKDIAKAKELAQQLEV